MLSLPDSPAAKPSLLDRIINALDDEEQQQLHSWLADPTISAPRIATALTNAGHRISASSIVSYRADKIR